MNYMLIHSYVIKVFLGNIYKAQQLNLTPDCIYLIMECAKTPGMQSWSQFDCVR